MKYTLSLRTGGLMEDPPWHYDNIRTIEASSLKEAIDKYAEEMGYLKDPLWSKERQTLWGWNVVDMVEEMKARNEEK